MSLMGRYIILLTFRTILYTPSCSSKCPPGSMKESTSQMNRRDSSTRLRDVVMFGSALLLVADSKQARILEVPTGGGLLT